MCDVIALPKTDLPDELIQRHRLHDKVHTRTVGCEEVWFFERERHALLPVWHEGRLMLYPWGGKSRGSKLPTSGSCRQEELEAGTWSWLHPEPVEILATFARSNGFWYDVPQGIRGIVVKDQRSQPHAYTLVTASTHYFRIMTRSEVEPVFVGPQI